MPGCTFWGHRDCSDSIECKLRETLIHLINDCEVTRFYVGNHGKFDSIAHRILKELSVLYPHITYTVVLAYMPSVKKSCNEYSDSETLLPDGIESVPKQYAILFRNKWMLQRSDYVIAFVNRPGGGAAQFAALAARQKKKIIRLGSYA